MGALPRRLPISVPPAPHEIVASYLARLATLNSHDGDQLWRRISTPGPTPARRIVNADRLAALTGRPASHLAGALPELRDPAPDWQMFRHAPQIGCPRCDAHHRGGAVLRILAHHRYVCTRHGYWIGPPDVNRPCPSLEYCPEVVAAQHRHLRLVQRYGWAAAYDAVLTALMICAHRWGHPDPTSGEELHQVLWTTRSFILIPKDSELHTFSASKLFACLYPEAVTLAPVIASPEWRRRAAGDDRELGQFVTEVRRRLRDSDTSYVANKTPSPTGSKATAGADPQRHRRTSPRHRGIASRVSSGPTTATSATNGTGAQLPGSDPRTGAAAVTSSSTTAHCTPSSSATGHHKCRNSAARSGTANAPRHDSKPTIRHIMVDEVPQGLVGLGFGSPRDVGYGSFRCAGDGRD